MIHFSIDELLEVRGWTRYRLAKELGMTEPAAYRLAALGRAVRRIDAATLEKLRAAFGVQPEGLLEYVPDQSDGARARRASHRRKGVT